MGCKWGLEESTALLYLYNIHLWKEVILWPLDQFCIKIEGIFPDGIVDKNPPAISGDTSLIPGPGRFYMQQSTKPMCHNYWASALEAGSHKYWARKPQLLKPVHLEPVLHNKNSHCNGSSPRLDATRESNGDPA